MNKSAMSNSQRKDRRVLLLSRVVDFSGGFIPIHEIGKLGTVNLNVVNSRLISRKSDVGNRHFSSAGGKENSQRGSMQLLKVTIGQIMIARNNEPKVKVLKVFVNGEYSIETYFLKSAKPAEEVLDFSSKRLVSEENERISEYVETLSSEMANHDLVGSFDDLIATVRRLDISDRVRHKTIDLLEKAYESTI